MASPQRGSQGPTRRSPELQALCDLDHKLSGVNRDWDDAVEQAFHELGVDNLTDLYAQDPDLVSNLLSTYTSTIESVPSYVARYLIEGDQDKNFYAKTFADRLLLRVFNSPSLMSYLRNMAVLDSQDAGVEPGSITFQLKFSKLPDEVIPQVKELIGVANIRVVEFEENHGQCTGFEFSLNEEELDFSGGDDKPSSPPPQRAVPQVAQR
jgi:hypothetical protein